MHDVARYNRDTVFSGRDAVFLRRDAARRVATNTQRNPCLAGVDMLHELLELSKGHSLLLGLAYTQRHYEANGITLPLFVALQRLE